MNNENFDNDYLIEYCAKEMMYKALINGFRRFGIERTEEMIKINMKDKQKELMLNGYKELVFKKGETK